MDREAVGQFCCKLLPEEAGRGTAATRPRSWPRPVTVTVFGVDQSEPVKVRVAGETVAVAPDVAEITTSPEGGAFFSATV